MIPKWPTRAMSAIATLWRPLQDIDVYVEDADSQWFYLPLLERLMPAEIRIRRVFPLCGRSAVELHAKQHSDDPDHRAIYLIDGDFQWVRGERPPEVDRLYQIQAYCVENLLIDEEAIVELLSECIPCTREEARSKFSYSSWIADLSSLIQVCVVFAALNKVRPEQATLSKHKLGDFLCNGKVDAAKVTSVITSLLPLVAKEAIGGLELLGVRRRVSELQTPIDIVSGKCYLLPLVEMRIKSLTGTSGIGSRKSLMVRLAKKVSLKRLEGLRSALERACRGNNVHHPRP